MPDIVKRALIKEGWTITHDPLHVDFGGVEFFIDLGAENLLGARKEGQEIAVEVKSFVGASSLSEFHTAVGQFVNYRLALSEVEPNRILYLAIPEDIHANLLQTRFGKLAIERHQLKIIVVDEEEERILVWIA
jgi:hypothetical protein